MRFVLLIVASFLIIACASPQCSIEASNEICYHPEGIAIPNKLSNYKTYNEYHAQYEPTLGNVKNVTTIKDKNTGCISYIFLDSLQNFSLISYAKDECDSPENYTTYNLVGDEFGDFDLKYYPRDSVESAFLEHIGIDRKTLLDAARKLRD
ncbi:MAG: hypothetical protein J6P30_01745 [Fibrobacter sp.]|nr:hypothetical protein [Fibrobacter sp.]